MDLKSAGQSGTEVLCPIIFLSARQSETDKVRGLTLGGDDYVTNPLVFGN